MQNKTPWWQVDFGEESARAAAAAIKSKNISQGPITAEVEAEVAQIVGSKQGIATSSGSTALTLALIAGGAKPGDTVICPAYSWIATAHAAHFLGLTLQLVDIEHDRPVIDVSRVPVSEQVRAFALPVHMNGHWADISELVNRGYTVIEDAAQALGSGHDGRFLGTLGNAGCFSFSMSKIVSSGQGGMVVTDDDDFADRARRARTHGVEDVFAPSAWPGQGHNFRFNDVLASILLAQLKKLDHNLEHVRNLRRRYAESLADCAAIEIVEHQHPREAGPYIEAKVSAFTRGPLVDYLISRGISARNAFPPIYSAKYLNFCAEDDFPNTKRWTSETLYLPSGPALTTKRVEQISETIQAFFGSKD